MPYFTRTDTGEVVLDSEIALHVARVLREQGGSDAWFKLPVE